MVFVVAQPVVCNRRTHLSRRLSYQKQGVVTIPATRLQ